MKAIRIDVDGTVDVLDMQKDASGTYLDALRKALNGAWVDHVNCGEVGRITSKVKKPHNSLSMWVDDEGALGASGLQVNMLTMGLLKVIGLNLGQNLYGPVVFTESHPVTGETGLQPETAKLLQGILHRLTIDNLDILADANKARRYTAVAHTVGKRTGVEILDTSDTDDVRAIGFHDAAKEHLTPVQADQLLDEAGWQRVDDWGLADWLTEGEDSDGMLTAPIRKK